MSDKPKKTEEATGDDKPKGGARPALIDKVDLVGLIWEKARLDKDGKAEGFPDIMEALLALKSFRDDPRKDDKYAKRYLENRMRKMMGQDAIPLPVFTDVPVFEKPKTKSELACSVLGRGRKPT